MCNPVEELVNVVEDTVDWVGETVDDTVDWAGETLDDAVDYVEENPLEAAALLAGAYYLAPELAGAEYLATGGELAYPNLAGEALVSDALGTGLTATAAGEGLLAPTAPALETMGGGTGLLTEAAGGGTLGATGVTAAGAVPILGDASSFINDPNVLGTPVVGYQAPTTSLTDAFRAARMISGLMQQPQQQQLNPYMLMQQQPKGLVDYSPTLSLLASRPTPHSLV